MRDQHIMDAIKGHILDLWIEIHRDGFNTFSYYSYLNELLYQQFQLKNVEYYFIEEKQLRKLRHHQQDFQSHHIALDCILTHIQNNSIHHLVSSVQIHHPEVNDALIIRQKGDVEGVLFFTSSPKWEEVKQSDYFAELMKSFYESARTIKQQYQNRAENLLNKELLKMTELFHSTMNAKHIIDALLQELESKFSHYDHQLILSNDQEHQLPKNVSVYDYINERPATTESFVSGHLVHENFEEHGLTSLCAPIKGRQGTYGVIRIEKHGKYHFTEYDERKLSFLGDTSGKALENAKLYGQSHRLVNDLQFINESFHDLNMNLSQKEMLEYLSKQISKAFKPSELAFVFMNQRLEIETGTTPYFYSNESAVYLEYIGEHFSRTNEPLFVADFQELINLEIPYASLMAVPIIIREKVHGFVLLVHEEAYYFSFDSYKLIQSIIRHSSLAISNVILREQLQEMVNRDNLTKLFARHYLDSFVEESMHIDRQGVFVLFDIDDFKQVNDKFGHHQGDRVLEHVAKIIQEEVGECGIGARWGGEELVVYLPNNQLMNSQQIIARISKRIATETVPKVTVSAGISYWNHHRKHVTYQSLFKEADAALYFAKGNGKNQAQVYTKKMEIKESL